MSRLIKHKIFYLLILCYSLQMPVVFSQNVGIGTTTPLGKLHIKGTANISQLIIDAHTTQSNTSPSFKLRSSSGSDLMWIHADTILNTFIGVYAGRVNNAPGGGVFNTYTGSHAGYSSSTGNSNSGFGANSLFLNTTGSFNSAHGLNSLFSNASGSWNTAIGANALFSNTSGNSNVALGNTALISNIDGSSNTAIGTDAMNHTISGSSNTASGFKALYNNTTGFNNTAVGDETLYTITTGNNNTAVGHGANVSTPEIINATAIGAKAYAGASNAVVIGSINGVNGATASASVGIGTSTPNTKAALEVKSTDKGILFPGLTNAQRNAISNPPHGLHVFNTEERCLNYYDSVYQIWNCYCDECKSVIINITQDTCTVDFYTDYAITRPANKYYINIAAGVTISGCNPGDNALSFENMPLNADITINNHGTIAGSGGTGGNGTIEQGCYIFSILATPGAAGGYAIATKPGVIVSIKNYGIVAGGGGGGGGSGKNPNGQGGGGGGGAGIVGGNGGVGGGEYQQFQFAGCIGISGIGEDGLPGQPTVGGIGGAGANGGAPGGNGGNRGQAGAFGTGNLSAPGGVAGKAIGGGSGNMIMNLGAGQSFGAID